MAFDDLARHMASRDKKKLGKVGSAADFVAQEAKAERRMNRTRDLILGPILLGGGLLLVVLKLLVLKDATDPTPDPMRPPEQGGTYPFYSWILALGMVGVGLTQTIRGALGRSKN